MRLDLFLTQVIDGYSREQIRRAVQEDGAEVDGRVKRPSFRLKAGQEIRFRVPPPRSDGPVPEAIPLDILYEDEGMVVVNKPPGMVVHPAQGELDRDADQPPWPTISNPFPMWADRRAPESCIGWTATPAV